MLRTPFEHRIFPPTLKTGVRALLLSRQSSISSTFNEESEISLPLASLPLHVLYNIMEFMVRPIYLSFWIFISYRVFLFISRIGIGSMQIILTKTYLNPTNVSSTVIR